MENKFEEWLEMKDPNLIPLHETTNRYSVEVNYRTSLDEVTDGFAKLCLGYVSAGMKNCGYHVKNIFDERPYRVLISTRNWDDGEWVGFLAYETRGTKKAFLLGDGHYNRDRKTVSVQHCHNCNSENAAEMCKDLRNLMEKLKKKNPRGSNTLEPAPMKPGPKPSYLKKLKKLTGPWKPQT
jgi:hypothetical protein